jgi:hypothetical protein
MPRTMVGLLAAVGAAMSVLTGLTHGQLVWSTAIGAATATGLAACFALPSSKKPLLIVILPTKAGT